MKDRFKEFQNSDPRWLPIEPRGWEDTMPLQPADFIAYEGMKWIDGSTQGRGRVRRSLRALAKTNIPWELGYFTDAVFRELLEEAVAKGISAASIAS